MQTFRILRYLIKGLVLVSGLAVIGCSPRYGEIVKGKHWEGLIVNSEKLPYRKGDPPMWTPSRDFVLSIEPALFEYINQYGKEPGADQFIVEHLSEYKVQYWGYYHNNQKVLLINFKHISHIKNGAWKIPSGTLGGGHYFFGVIYNVEKSVFTKIVINADA